MKKYIAIISILILIIIAGCIKQEAKEESKGEQELIPPTEEMPAEITEEPEIIYANLTAEKTMTLPAELTINMGTTIIWTNLDKSPHNLIIYDTKDPDLKDEDLTRSENINSGETYQYTFDKRGTFMIKDVYSGQMRTLITA
ncbi:cupredoxin domain-containing protein, partial [Candidatus Woesearchaeota archaeon]|nr:cupredoxin domain-containing protein [Candidatus Woesearchaeota archaeon]